MTDVFVSYKREDAAKVRKLVTALRGTGLDLWWDEDIPASAPWEATIEKALAGAKAVIVCWSPASVASENVRSEARVAREDGRLIQVFLKPCNPPLFFGERQGIELGKWRGDPADPRIGKIAEAARAIASGKRVDTDGPYLARNLRSFNARIAASIAALVLVVGVALGLWLLRPAQATGPQTLAVLPFRALSGEDANLVDAIWDDTRGAISHNPNLRVLGRQAVEAMAKRDLSPDEYRTKLGVDYLLDGNVQRSGKSILMNVSLTRTSDGAQVWSDRIVGKLDDVFAFQTQIATDVEGRIRGRVAPGGGIKARNIATTGDVYATYAEARAKMHERSQQALGEGMALLQKVVAADPNYAPGWAELGAGRILYWMDHKQEDERTADATSYLHRALTLAPNLAHAHAALGQALGTGPGAETELRRAVALDPGDAEAWNWLGNLLGVQNRLSEALQAYDRAVEIEPVWSSSVGNKLNTLDALNDEDGVRKELKRLERTGDEPIMAKVQAWLAFRDGHPGDWLRIWLQFLVRHPEERAFFEGRAIAVFVQLGFIDEAARIAGADPVWARAYKFGTLPPPGFGSGPLGYARPVQLWLDDDNPAILGRLMLKQGRGAEYVGYYRAAFEGPGDYVKAFSVDRRMIVVTPTVAAVLRATGERAEADGLVERAEPLLIKLLRNGPATPDLLIQLAEYRALDGRDDESVGLLRRAVAGGWLPDRKFYAIDIADEPCFARLVDRADFQAIRRHILARIEEERRKVTPVLLARAGYSTKAAA